MDSFKKVIEATYLTADRAWSYRAILRYFYIQHERMREFLFPEEILGHLRQLEGFTGYTEDQLHQDLSALVKWGNLIASQDSGKARTVEEYIKKRFRYQCTAYTVEFERMLQQMEHMGETFGGSLEKTQFERLYQSLVKVEGSFESNIPSEEAAQLWEDVLTYYRKITQNTADYLAYLNSEEVEQRMQTEAFLVYKDQFTAYLRDFIIALQQTALQIQELIQSVDRKQLEKFLEKVVAHQEQTFRFEELVPEERLTEELEKWRSLSAWFLGNIHGDSEYAMLQMRTNEAIRRVTRVVQRLGERHQHFRSRKQDYLHLAKWFDSLEDINEAHELSAIAFGVFHTRHFHSDHIPTDDIYSDVWEERPMEHVTKPRVRTFTEKTRAGAMVRHEQEKEQMRKAHLRQRRLEQELLEKYITNGEIRTDALPVIEKHVRKVLLAWVGKAMARKDRIIKTETGRQVQVVIGKGRTTLASEDGSLEMPKVVFRFLDGGRNQ
ncbi:TIGR02677 family protein [Thalassobacillus devorans]|uniref:TIGR02677 family protein n=1 Tax=Thalassobacillus devorans TaxID=279813 RepID=UPI0004BB77AB|nr:TIGR02677 family protein [Thalassobacillus devorans]